MLFIFLLVGVSNPRRTEDNGLPPYPQKYSSVNSEPRQTATYPISDGAGVDSWEQRRLKRPAETINLAADNDDEEQAMAAAMDWNTDGAMGAGGGFDEADVLPSGGAWGSGVRVDYSGGNSGGADDVRCFCNQPCIKLTSRQPTSLDRQFYKCNGAGDFI